MSQLVKLLEQRDCVEQVADPTDTETKVIRLTKRGIALRRACEDVRKELAATAQKTLGKKDLSKLHQDLNRLIASIRNFDYKKKVYRLARERPPMNDQGAAYQTPS